MPTGYRTDPTTTAVTLTEVFIDQPTRDQWREIKIYHTGKNNPICTIRKKAAGQRQSVSLKLEEGKDLALRLDIRVEPSRWGKQVVEQLLVRDREIEEAITGADGVHIVESALLGSLQLTFAMGDRTLERLRAQVEQKKVLFDRVGLGRAGTTGCVGIILNIGTAVSELHPIAKIVVGLVKGLFDTLEAQQGVQSELLDLLDAMIISIELFAKVKVDEAIPQTVISVGLAMERVKTIIEETKVFAQKWAASGNYRLPLSKEDKKMAAGLKERFVFFSAQFHTEVTVQIFMDVKGVSDQLKSMQDDVLQLKLMRDDMLLSTLQDVYKGTNVSAGNEEGCHVGTRETIITEILDWAALEGLDVPKILWLHAMPGAGKSAIARTVVDRLKRSERHSNFAADFFFRRDDIEKRTPFALWCHILFKLASRYPVFRDAALSRLRADGFDLASSKANDIVNVITNAANSLLDKGLETGPLPVIVIDALDECPQTSSSPVRPRDSVLEALIRLPRQCFRVLVASRPETDIDAALRPISQSMHLQTGTEVDNQSSLDVQRFLSASLRPYPHLQALNIKRLTEKAAGLFIWATTAVQYLAAPGSDAEERLQNVMDGGFGTGDLSKLYHLVLASRFSEKPDARIHHAFQRIVGTILAAVRPLTRIELEELLGCHESATDLEAVATADVIYVLGGLETVLLSQTSGNGTLQFSHLSFPEFLAHEKSQTCFYGIQDSASHSYLASRCLHAMQTRLRFNICQLPSSHYPNSHYEDLSDRLDLHVSLSLRYAVQHWSFHLSKSPSSDHLLSAVTKLLDTHLLFWLEISSLLKFIGKASRALNAVSHWLQDTADQDASSPVVKMAKDGALFAAYFFECISQSAAHIYISALSFSPTSSYLATHYRKAYNAQLELSSGLLEDWPPVKKALRGYISRITSTTISPSGGLLAAGSEDGTIYVWNVETGELVVGPLMRDAGRASWVTSIAFFPDEDTIASGSTDGTLCVWDCVAHRCSAAVEAHEDEITSVAVSGDGRNIVSGSWDRTIAVWTVDNLEFCVRSKPEDRHDGNVKSVALSPDLKSFVSIDENTIRFWSIETGQLILQGKETVKDLESVAWSPDGTCVAAVDFKGLIYLWRVPNRTTITHIGQERIDKSRHQFISFSSDGCYIITISISSVSLWDVSTGKTVCPPFKLPFEDVCRSVFCDGTHITYVDASSQVDHIMLHVWNIEAIDSSTQPRTSSKFGTGTAFSPDGKYIVSADETLRVWSTETAALLVGPINVHTGYVTCVAFSHDSKRIVSGSADGSLCVWNADTGDLVHGPWSDDQIQGHLTSVLVSHDGNRIVCGSSGGVFVLSSMTGEIIHALKTDAGRIPPNSPCLAISSDGSLIASTLEYGEFAISHSGTGETLRRGLLSLAYCLAFSPDGKEIAAGSWRGVEICNIETAIVIASVPLQLSKHLVSAIAFSPDGKYLVCGGEDNKLNLWKRTSVDNWSHIAMINGHSDSNSISSVAFSPDGTWIGSASRDSTICLWGAEKLTQWDSGTANHWALCDDGWVRQGGEQGKLLFYVPLIHRPGFRQPTITRVIGGDHTEVDMSDFIHGDEWEKGWIGVKSD